MIHREGPSNRPAGISDAGVIDIIVTNRVGWQGNMPTMKHQAGPNRRDFLKSAFGLAGGLSVTAAIQAAVPYSRPKLRITDIRTAEVRAHGHQVHVRVYTDDPELFGEGECTDAAHGAASIIQQHFRRFLIGQDPLNVDYLFERIRTGGIFGGAQGGQYVTALTGVDHALLDLAGKATGLPVYQLLGGKMRDKVRVYCDSARHEKGSDEAIEMLEWIKDAGFTAVKIDCDDRNNRYRIDEVNWTANNLELDLMFERVDWVRQQLPRSIDLAVDGHGRFDMTTGKRLAKRFEPLELMFFEEPVPAENVGAMRDVRESTSTPICMGENVYLRHGFVPYLEQRAADVIMPDLQKCGGLLEGRKIADMAHAYYVPFAPHCVVSPIGTMGSAHCCAAVPNFLALEWHWIGRLDLWKNFVQEGEIIQDGFITLPDKPGFGVTMNEEAAKSQQVPGTPWFEPWTAG
jgi:galactonate dehydratase